MPIRHQSINRLVFHASYARLDEHATLLLMAPVTFDAATFEIWGALLHGGTCVLYPSTFVRFGELRRLIERHGVTVIFLTTALFNTIVDEAPGTLDRCARFSPAARRTRSDTSTPRCAATARTASSVCTGRPSAPRSPPTTPYATRNRRSPRCRSGGRSRTPGRTSSTKTTYRTAGEIGEVLLGGPGLAPGYLSMPDVTAARFVDFRLAGRPVRLYRTGDRAYLRPDGNLVFQGRDDDQVKINGHRIELGEIGLHLGQHPEVKQSYVTVDIGATGEKTLIAFVAGRGQHDPAGLCDALRDFLRDRLPGYMVPAAYHLREALPLTATGKVDRLALLAAVREPAS